MTVCVTPPIPSVGADTSSLAELSYALHQSLADEHNGKERWQYRPLTTLSVDADISDKRRKQAGTASAPATALAWLDKSIVSHTSTIGTPQTTSQVHPRLMTEALVEISRSKGLEVVFGTVDALVRGECGFEVTGDRRDGGVRFSIETDKVVVAAGPWTGALVRKLGQTLDTPLKGGRSLAITGSRAHSVLIRPPGPAQLPAQALFTSISRLPHPSSLLRAIAPEHCRLTPVVRLLQKPARPAASPRSTTGPTAPPTPAARLTPRPSPRWRARSWPTRPRAPRS